MNEYDDGTEQRSSRTGQAAKGAAKKGAKKAGKSVGKKLLILLGVKGILWVLVIGLILLVIAAAAGAISNTAAAQPAGCGGTPTTGAAPVAVAGTAPGGTTPEQWANAQAIAGVALGLGLGRPGVVVGVVAALTESGMRTLNYGDMTGPGGSMSDSRGEFQMKSAWGSLPDRLDPTKSATIFYTIDKGPGVRGLMHIDGWQQMGPAQAAQAVEGSEFTDASNYTQQLPLAQSVTDALMVGQPASTTSAAVPVAAAACPPAASVGAAVALNGPVVTIPDNQFVTPALRGKPLTTPNAGVAKGIAAGFAELGKPYVWGGFNDDGCARGGGALNSCQGVGTTVGGSFDCSGLTAYVIMQGGFPNPGGESGTQRSTGTDIPWAQGQPGDIVGFPGHVAIYLGNIGGTDYILEASDVGIPIHVVPLTRTDHDSSLHRHWS
jgi:cell wall-associated NlpC family hydrolase